MTIITGTSVDLLTPFPPTEAPRAWGWNHCYRTFVEDDLLPKDREGFALYVQELLVQSVSCGVVDKSQLTSSRHEAPLVGLITLTPLGPRNALLHFAAGRKAFKMGLVEEALSIALPGMFVSLPDLTRITCALDESNTPVKSLLRRLGFRFEGVMQGATVANGALRPQVLFGLARPSTVEVASMPTEVAVATESETTNG